MIAASLGAPAALLMAAAAASVVGRTLDFCGVLEGGSNYQKVGVIVLEEDGQAVVALPFGSLPAEFAALKLEVREDLRRCSVQFVAIGTADTEWTPSAVQGEHRAALNDLRESAHW